MAQNDSEPVTWRPKPNSVPWSAPVDYADPRMEAVCRRFCAMGGMDPDKMVGGSMAGSAFIQQWQRYAAAAAQYLDAADSVDPLRQVML